MATPGGSDELADGLRFYQRFLSWRLRSGELLLFLDLPCAGDEALFEALAARFPPAAVRTSRRWPREPADLARIADEVRGARLMRAHVDYEFYRFLPRPPSYVTVLRDPVARVAALYEHVRGTPDHPYHERVVAARLSLHEFVCEPAFAADIVDVQARRVAGRMFRDEAPADRVLLEMALANLGEFAFFGMADRKDDSRFLLAHTFGWPPSADPPARWGGREPVDLGGITAAAREAIEARTRVDRALVRFADEQFEQRIAIALHELLEQNARLGEPYLATLNENDRLRKEDARRRAEHEELERSWSWRTTQRLRRWRRAVLPPGSRRDGLYQRIGTYLYGRGGSAP